MTWDVEYTDEFGDWWESLTVEEQESIAASVRLLEDFGTNLKFPHRVALMVQNMNICAN